MRGPVASAVPGFVMMSLVAGAAADWLWVRRHPTGRLSVEQRQACWFDAAGLASTLLFPALAVYWENSQNWGNNAFHHFETRTAEAPLRAPRHSFIVVNDLDPVALCEKFGAPGVWPRSADTRSGYVTRPARRI